MAAVSVPEPVSEPLVIVKPPTVSEKVPVEKTPPATATVVEPERAFEAPNARTPAFTWVVPP